MYGFPNINAVSASLTGGLVGNTQFNDLDLGAWGGDSLRLTGPLSAINITGIADGFDGRVIAIFNRTGFTVTLKEQSGSSILQNRFALGADLAIASGKCVELYYDGSDQRWCRVNSA